MAWYGNQHHDAASANINSVTWQPETHALCCCVAL
jgi:hypothetical protein